MASPGNTGMRYRWSDETRLKAKWTRINNCAHNDQMTLAQFAAQDDARLLATPNMGPKCLKLLRERFPK